MSVRLACEAETRCGGGPKFRVVYRQTGVRVSHNIPSTVCMRVWMGVFAKSIIFKSRS